MEVLEVVVQVPVQAQVQAQDLDQVVLGQAQEDWEDLEMGLLMLAQIGGGCGGLKICLNGIKMFGQLHGI